MITQKIKKYFADEFIIMFLLGIRSILSISTAFPIFKYISAVSTILLICLSVEKFIRTNQSRIWMFVYFLLFSYALLSTFLTGKLTRLVTVVVLFSLQNNNLKEDLKVLHYTKLVLIIFNTLYYLFSYYILKANLEVVYDYRFGIRHSFFLGHPNTMSSIVLGLFLEDIFIYYKNFNIFRIFKMLIITFVVYYFTISRTMLVLTIFVLLFLLFFKNRRSLFSFLLNKKVLVCFMIFINVISFYTMFTCSNEFLKNHAILYKLDSILSWRFRYSNWAYRYYGITILPRKEVENVFIEIVPYVHKKLSLDNMYVKFATQYGLIWWLLFDLTILKGIKFAGEKEIIYIYILLLYTFVESSISFVGIVPILVIIVYNIFNHKNDDTKGKLYEAQN